jgi:hypothetical protein
MFWKYNEAGGNWFQSPEDFYLKIHPLNLAAHPDRHQN